MKYKTILVVYKNPLLSIYNSKNKELCKLIEEGLDIEDLKAEQVENGLAKRVLEQTFAEHRNVKVDWVYRADLSRELVSEYELIITFGGDGTLLNASHYLKETPIFGINSDYRPTNPLSSEGFFTGATKEDFKEKYADLQNGRLKEYQFNRLQLELNGKRLEELVLNEAVVIHKIPVGTSRMVLRDKKIEEFQKNDGLIIATAASNWGRLYGANLLPIDSSSFSYVSRGLYLGRLNPNPRLKKGVTTRLEVDSKMREGLLFIDGKHICYPFGLGAKLKVYPSKNKLKIIGFDDTRRNDYYTLKE